MATDSTRSGGRQALAMTTTWPRRDVCLVRLRGALDMATSPLLADHLQGHTARGPSYLLFDLAALKFLAAAGMTLLVSALHHENGIRGEVRLIGVTDNRSVGRILDLSQLRAEFTEHDDIEEALHSIAESSRAD